MRLIKPSFEILEQESGIQGIYKQIERAGRTCYKSEDRITEDSAEKFVNMIKDRQHTAMLEHGTVYLETENPRVYYKYVNKQYSKVNIIKYTKTGSDIITPQNPLYERGHVTTNYRVLYENNWLDDLKYLCEPTEYHEKRITVKFICDRGVSHELVRHRVFSFAQESTRYCNYSKDKFGKELTFIEPCWLEDYNYDDNTYNQLFIDSLRWAEAHYLDLLKKWEDKIPGERYKTGFRNNPWTPQQARAVLPNALKTELVMTGFISDWEHFFDLRCDKAAHPQARELAVPLKEEFIKRNLINS